MAKAKTTKSAKVKYRLESVIVCEDVRQEINSKSILIGVYDGLALVNTFPARFPKLIVRFGIKLFAKAESLHFQLVTTDGRPRVDSILRIEAAEPNDSHIFGFLIQNVELDEEDSISIRLGIDAEPVEVASLQVRMPVDEEEERLLGPK